MHGAYNVKFLTLNVTLCKIVSVPANNVNLLVLLGIWDLQIRVWRGSAVSQLHFASNISLVSVTVGVRHLTRLTLEIRVGNPHLLSRCNHSAFNRTVTQQEDLIFRQPHTVVKSAY
jgi:hypothetical protein